MLKHTLKIYISFPIRMKVYDSTLITATMYVRIFRPLENIGTMTEIWAAEPSLEERTRLRICPLRIWNTPTRGLTGVGWISRRRRHKYTSCTLKLSVGGNWYFERKKWIVGCHSSNKTSSLNLMLWKTQSNVFSTFQFLHQKLRF